MQKECAQLKAKGVPSNNLKDSVSLIHSIWQRNWDFKTPKNGTYKGIFHRLKNPYTNRKIVLKQTENIYTMKILLINRKNYVASTTPRVESTFSSEIYGRSRFDREVGNISKFAYSNHFNYRNCLNIGVPVCTAWQTHPGQIPPKQ